MRILGIDFGVRRHGLAISDEMGFTAQPAGLVERRGRDPGLDEIERIAREKAGAGYVPRPRPSPGQNRR